MVTTAANDGAAGDGHKSEKQKSEKCQSAVARVTGAMSCTRISVISFSVMIFLLLPVLPLIAGAPAANLEETNAESPVKQETLRQVTVLMRHGERAPVDTYPNDPYVNDTMAPYGWGQLTNKGRVHIYNTGLYLRNRYDDFLGNLYSPDVFWLQSTSSDRTKMTAMILASSLWIPDQEQTFKEGIPWQPVSFQYWTRTEDNLLIIWNACPKLTLERTLVNNDTKVRQFNAENEQLYAEIEKLSGHPIRTAEDLSDLYSTLTAEAQMEGIELPAWTEDYFPERMLPAVLLSYRMNVYNGELRKLAGGPFVKKLLRTMIQKQSGTLSPKDRKMYAYVAHDSTLVNVLSALGVWDGTAPDYSSMLIVELHEENGKWNVQLFEKPRIDAKATPLKLPYCDISCPLEKFAKIVSNVIPSDYTEDCQVPDPNFVVPPAPAA